MTFKTKTRDLISFREEVSCSWACPSKTDCGMYVQLTAQEKFEEGYLTARWPNPFASSCGRVCAAPCEDSCRRGRVGEPISIRSIKKFLCEMNGPENYGSTTLSKLINGALPTPHFRSQDSAILQKIKSKNESKKIAVIGAGPAGLSCAHDLAILGYSVTVFESSGFTGGMMRLGIPSYRLPDKVLDEEVDVIRKIGVEIKTGHKVEGIKELMRQGFEAVFMGAGATAGRSLKIEGADLENVHIALDFLVDSNKGIKRDLGKKVMVIGGGLVALDAARDAQRNLLIEADLVALDTARNALRNILEAREKSGISSRQKDYEIHLASLEKFEEMPANMSTSGRQEVEETIDEGIQIHSAWGPNRILGQDGKVTAMELVQVERVFDEQGRFNPTFNKDVKKVIPCDSVVLAIGQASDLSLLSKEDEVETTPRGTVKIDPENFMTSLPGVFAGGDLAFGPRNMINAVADGKNAAISIDNYLNKTQKKYEYEISVEVFNSEHYRMIEDYDVKTRQTPALTPAKERTGIKEVELSFSKEEVLEQASRCLTCHTSPIFDGTLCILCGRCTDICPEFCLTFVPFGDVEIENSEKDQVLANSEVDQNGEMTALLKDDDKCIRCGLCAIRCPTGALMMEKIIVKENPFAA